VRERLHDGLDRSWSLGEIAQSAGVTADHLAREFRRHHGSSVGEYVRGLRVELACRRLAESDDPLAEIALAAGFYDQSHFTRTFKRRMGTTPAAFRALHRSRRSRTKS
jgi:AraC family transcriptional regulator